MTTYEIPADAIDPEAGYRLWVDSFLWHVDQLPYVVETTVTLVVASRGLQAQQLRERVSGGGFYDNIPIADGPEGRNAAAVWQALRAYLVAAASRIGIEAPELPPAVPGESDLARDWAYAANEWLADQVHHIVEHPELGEAEEALFRLIRRARRQQGEHRTVRRAAPEACDTCGAEEVRIDWVDGPDGQRVLEKACATCGERFTSD
ncbi:hypothetical protein [Microbacterium thalli]|uniref:hypothetical protein n=1 Tax=Microbacterium thalli TaxID=3027921 RepID=UPI00236726BE|nr:hypothetical protein [Microbacterium thalli]MDD7930091.1 hypothetical protein [Microbacterium thalli]